MKKYFIQNGYNLNHIFINTFSKMDGWQRTYNLSSADFIYYPLKSRFDTDYHLYNNGKTAPINNLPPYMVLTYFIY